MSLYLEPLEAYPQQNASQSVVYILIYQQHRKLFENKLLHAMFTKTNISIS